MQHERRRTRFKGCPHETTRCSQTQLECCGYSHSAQVGPPIPFADDLCFTPQLVASFVNAYTKPGDVVFDPFAGFGTTHCTALHSGSAGQR